MTRASRTVVRWRLAWALAQIVGILFSTVVWVVLIATVPLSVLVIAVCATVVLLAGETRPVLWLRYGARSASAAERELVLRAIVPVGSLRGRRQPWVFVGRGWRARHLEVLAVSSRRLLIGERLVGRIGRGRLGDEAVSAMVAYTFGQLPARSRLIAAVELYTGPWRFVSAIADGFRARARRIPLFRLAWAVRPILFGLGALDAIHRGRWVAAGLVTLLAVLTYATGRLDRARVLALRRLGEQRVIDEHLNPSGFPATLDDATVWRAAAQAAPRRGQAP